MKSPFKLRNKATAPVVGPVEGTPESKGSAKITMPHLPEGYSWAVVPTSRRYYGRVDGIDGDSDQLTHDLTLKGPGSEGNGDVVLYRENIAIEREFREKNTYYTRTYVNFDVTPKSVAYVAGKMVAELNADLAKEAAKAEAKRKKLAAIEAAKAFEGDYAGGAPLT